MLKTKYLLNPVIIIILIITGFLYGAEDLPKTDSKEFLLGKYLCSKRQDFKKISSKYSDATPHYLLNDAAKAFEKMAKSAANDGISLYIVSGFRSFAKQKQIFEEKFLGHRLVDEINLLLKFPNSPEKRIPYILKYTAIPGTSRHHWGTDLDINSVEVGYFLTEQGEKVYNWLVKNASDYGFFQPYHSENSGGYNEEKWHWSYYPTAKICLNNFKKNVNINDIKGFKGDNFLPENLINNYVLNIKDFKNE